VKLQRVIFKNFKSYPDEDTTIDLSFVGKKLVSGVNGGGKSSIIDSIVWCLFGKTIGSADSVVNRKTGINCKVEVLFKVAHTNYSIIRYRNHEEKGNKIFIFKNKKDITVKNAPEIERQISEITGLTYTSLVSSCVFSTETYTEFLRARPSDRLKAIESILPLGFISVYVKQLKKMMKPIEDDLEEKKNELRDLMAVINSTENSKKDYLLTASTQINKLKAEKTELESDILVLKSEIDFLKHTDVEKELKTISINEENNKLEETISTLTKSLVNTDFFYDKLKTKKKELDELTKINILDELNLIHLFEKFSARKLIIEPLIIQHKKIDDERKIQNSKLNNLKKEQDLILEKTSSFKSHLDLCPTCNQVINKEKQDIILKSYSDSVSNLEIEIEKLTSKEDYYEKNFKSLIDLNFENTSLQSLIVKPNFNKEYLDNIPNEIKTIKNDIELTEKQISEVVKNNTESLNKIQALRFNIIAVGEIKFAKEELLNIKDKIKAKEDEILKKENELESIKKVAISVIDRSFVSKLDKSISDSVQRKGVVEDETRIVINTKKHYDAMYELLSNGDSGFKKFFINKILGIFNERINMYLPYFFNQEISVFFDKNLNEKITFGGNVIEFSTLSSGQKTRVELAIALSLFIMVKTFFATNISFLVFDEILDKNLDTEGLNAVNTILTELAKTNTIFVISHNEILKDRFNEILYIIQRNGFSYVE